jgi:hypothetical protein
MACRALLNSFPAAWNARSTVQSAGLRTLTDSTVDWWRIFKGVAALVTGALTLNVTHQYSKAYVTSQLYHKYPKVSKCTADIGYFYQERQRLKDDENRIPLNERKGWDMKAIAKDWAKEKRSKTHKPSEEVKHIDDCRQVTTNFFKHAYYLLDKGLVDKDVFAESFYARSGNFKRLVEPLDKANFMLVNPTGKYVDCRPTIYPRIEKAENDPKTGKYFQQ